MTKFVATMSLFAFTIGIASADEINGTVKKVDGNKITIIKGKAKGAAKGTKGEEVVLTTTDNVKVSQGTFNKKAKTYSAGDALTGGLQDPVFAKKNTKVHVTTNADNKVTEVLVLSAKKKKAS